METRVAEIADGIHQLMTYMPDMDFAFNQYIISGDEPLLWHTGMRGVFPLVSEAVSRVVPAAQVRWISFGHFEADECGAMNEWLALAPQSSVVQGNTGCMVSIGDQASRAPRPLADGEVLDIGGHRMRWIDTPHVPHAWEAGLLYDETTKTLFCGDLLTQTGNYPATSADDMMGPAIIAEDLFRSSSLAPQSGTTCRRLAELDIETLALMHGPAYAGDCRAALLDLADDYEKRIAALS